MSEEKARQRTTTTPEQIESKHTYRGRKTVHTICDKDNNDKDENFVLDSIETTPIAKIESIYKKGSKSQAFANIQLRGQTTDILVECNIDSGAEVNVMPLLYTNTCSQNRKTSMDDQSLYRNPRSV